MNRAASSASQMTVLIAIIRVLCLSVVFAAIFWTSLPASVQVNESTDYSRFYEPVARRIQAGQGYTLPDGTLALRSPPGYPLILAGLFRLAEWIGARDQVVLSGFILLCHGCSSVLLLLLSSATLGIRKAEIGSWLWITYPGALYLTKQPNSEVPFLVLFYAAVCLFWALLARSERCGLFLPLVSGVLVGLSALVRPIALWVGPVLVGLLLVQSRTKFRRRFYLAGMLAVGYLLPLVPWEAWVYARTGEVVLMRQGGAVGSVRDGITFAADEREYGPKQRVCRSIRNLMNAIQQRRREGRAKSLGAILGILIDESRSNPSAMAGLILWKAARSWYGTDSGRFDSWILLAQTGYLLLISMGAWAAWRGSPSERSYCVLLLSLAAYFWFMTVVALSIVRYMIPVLGLLLTLVPFGLFRDGRFGKGPCGDAPPRAT